MLLYKKKGSDLMSEAVLVLNQSNEILDISSIKKAIKKVCNERAEVLETYTDQHLRSWKQAMEAPAVIRLLHFVKLSHNINRTMPFTRKNVWLRDKGHCQYCNKFVPIKDMSWDHVVPRDQGGRSCWQNIVVSCVDCNRKKDCRTPEQAGMKLLSYPKAPTYQVSRDKEIMMRLRSLKYLPSESWRPYIYFNIELDQE
jgi:5-methylcytosine-specific restriction endonuclease McrA